MNTLVIKRDGRLMPFDSNRLHASLLAAASTCSMDDEHYCATATQQIIASIDSMVATERSIESPMLAQTVEQHLSTGPYPEMAIAYRTERERRDHVRTAQMPMMAEIQSLISQSNDALLHENANKDGKVIPTQRDLLAGIVAKQYAKQFLLPHDVVQAHEKGEIHYHDLDYSPFFPMFNCMLIDLEGMLTHGFKMGNADIESPKSIATAAAVTAQIIAQVASHIYGGTTIDRIDEILAPYVTKSYEKHYRTAQEWQISEPHAYAQQQTEKECYNAFQSLEYEVNTLHTANGQTPFVTFGFGLGLSKEARLIQQSILKVRIDGLGKHHRTAIFPKLVFALKKGVNLQTEDLNYDIKQLALQCASLRMYPDILNYDRVVEITGSFKTPMGCRSFLDHYEVNGETSLAGRNNLGVVSLNLPRIAIEAEGDEARFWKILDERLAIAHKALMTRIARLETVKAQVAPILYMEGACGVRLHAEESIAEIFKNGRASISLGYIGLHETILALFGSDISLYDSAERQEKAIEIVRYLRAATDRWKAESGYGFSLYSTPSENLCDRFCRLDCAAFGLIEGVTDKGFYTNSFHLDVEQAVNPYDKIDFEAPYPAISSGGFICYGEYPNLQHNLKALEDVWDYSYERIPYYGTNTPIDRCYACGFTGEFSCTSKGFTCPSCGNHNIETVSVIRRVCGYLGSPDARPFNQGKQEEVRRRVKHMPSAAPQNAHLNRTS